MKFTITAMTDSKLLSEELKEALGVIERVCQHMGAVYAEKGVPLPELKDGELDLSIRTARSAAESLFSKLLAKEAESQRRLEMADELIRLQSAELDSLRDSVLTREEMAATVRALEMKPPVSSKKREQQEWSAWNSALAKLRNFPEKK